MLEPKRPPRCTPPNRASRIAGGAILLGLVAGCAFTPLDPPAPLDPKPEPPPIAAQPPPAAPAAPPAPAPPPPAPAAPAPRPIALVLLPRQPGVFAATLSELEPQLEARRFEVEIAHIEVFSDPAAWASDDTTSSAWQADDRFVVGIAVGSEAARFATRTLGLPTVFSHIPDRDIVASDAYGVATAPPPALQLEAWLQLDPRLERVGLILSRGETRLAALASDAAERLGIVLELRTASSDREALYLFKRLVPHVDGLWILPDNDILSPRALREILDHANSHGVQSLAFSPALLEWGALASVSATAADTARTLAGIVERVAAGEPGIPPLTPLSELEIQVNVEAAAKFGLSPPATSWKIGAP